MKEQRVTVTWDCKYLRGKKTQMSKFKNLCNSSCPILVEKQSIPDQSAKNYSKKLKKKAMNL